MSAISYAEIGRHDVKGRAEMAGVQRLIATIPAAPTPPDQTPPHFAVSDFPIG